MAKHPKFGDRLLNTVAGEHNPHRECYFVRTVRRTGRLNPGLFYECTDGNGEMFLFPPERMEIVEPRPMTAADALAFIDPALTRERVEAMRRAIDHAIPGARARSDIDGLADASMMLELVLAALESS